MALGRERLRIFVAIGEHDQHRKGVHAPGEEAAFHLSTSAPKFSVEIVRIGAETKSVWSKKDLPGKFLIVSDVYPTATTELADLILPSAMWVEKNGVVGNSERRTQQWFKMVNPPGDARDDCWQAIAVARKLFDLGFPGMKDKDGKEKMKAFAEKMNDDEIKAIVAYIRTLAAPAK